MSNRRKFIEMKQQNRDKIQLVWQITSGLILLTIIGLSIFEVTKIKLPKISDRDIIFWLTEFD